ncbi:uncharacterized protein LOC110675484 [Aedes aegypti]|uniref:Uncharacterized protein n=1 Tax=Aedes aegypti TaxID=7159 RepID=A0A6I8TNG4_AEDAE|nr:uncharacterized protein LOC110675484 [Aedes aegypti]
MNCSCSSSQCPHVQYVRKLLETTEKDHQAPPPTLMQKSLPQIQNAAWYIASAIKEIFFIWIAITKIVLRLWLNLLDSNSYLWLAFLMFAFGLICSLPGIRGDDTSMPAVTTWSSTSEVDVLLGDGAITSNALSTELTIIR